MAIPLDEDLLEMLGVSEDSQAELSISGDALVITPARDDERRRKFERSMEKIDEKYAGVFRRLAKS